MRNERSVDQKDRPALISDKYPGLKDVLNDPTTPLPAYLHFQAEQDQVLREDLRMIKARLFKDNYQREIQRPKEFMKQ